MKMRMTLAAAVALTMIGAASAQTLHTGAEGGFYRAAGDKIASSGLPFGLSLDIASSAGSAENLKKVIAKPSDFGMVQADAFWAAVAADATLGDKLAAIPLPGVNDCSFFILKNSETPVSFRQIRSTTKTRQKTDTPVTIFVAKDSGSAVTLGILREVDKENLGVAKVVEVATADEAVAKAFDTKNAVAFLMQFADPQNARFKDLAKAGGMLTPLDDGSISALKVGGKQVYSLMPTTLKGAVNVRDSNGNFSAKVQALQTICTPTLLITGKPGDDVDRQRMVEHLRGLKANQFIPAGRYAWAQKWTSELVAKSKKIYEDMVN